MNTILVIARHPRFSPQAVEKDRLILQAVGLQLQRRWHVMTIEEEHLTAEMLAAEDIDGVVSMARTDNALRLLEQAEQCGMTVINTPLAVRLCSNRQQLYRSMEENGFLLPPAKATTPCWLKRADGWTEHPDEVNFSATDADLKAAKALFARRGIDKMITQQHVEGQHVKFYGVGDTILYPADFPLPPIHAHLNIDIYGGDAIIDEQGKCYIVDLNDFPSFAVCRAAAAQAIAHYVTEKLQATA